MIPAPAKPAFCQLATEPDRGRYRHHCAHCRLSVATGRPNQSCAAGPPRSQHVRPTTPASREAPQLTTYPPDSAPAVPPSLPRRLANFTVAAIAHLVHGLPTCDQDEIDRWLIICEACPYFNEQICTHKTCGCNVSNVAKFLNKLAWADQRCPVGKW